jgi:hypothetical protein
VSIYPISFVSTPFPFWIRGLIYSFFNPHPIIISFTLNPMKNMVEGIVTIKSNPIRLYPYYGCPASVLVKIDQFDFLKSINLNELVSNKIHNLTPFAGTCPTRRHGCITRRYGVRCYTGPWHVLQCNNAKSDPIYLYSYCGCSVLVHLAHFLRVTIWGFMPVASEN